MRLSKLIIPVVGFVAIGVIVAMTSQKEQRIEEEKKAQIAKSEREKQQKITQCQSEFSNIQLTCQSSSNIDEIRNAIEGFSDRCTPYLGEKISQLISFCSQKIKEHQAQQQNQVRLQHINQCNKEFSNIQLICQSSNSIDEIRNAVEGFADRCAPYLGGKVSYLTSLCGQRVREIENKEREEEKQAQEREKQNRCIKEYSTLEKEFQDTTRIANQITSWGKWKSKIAEIKAQALQLKEEGCDRYTGGSVSRLIAKCDDKLN